MKKITFLIMMVGAVLTSISSYAAPRQTFAPREGRVNAPLKVDRVIKNKTLKSLPETSRKIQHLPARQAAMTDIIYDAPGIPTNYLKTADCFIIYFEEQRDFSVTINWDENGDVYFLDIISLLIADTYVKGSYADNIITLPMNQTVYYDEDEGYGMNLGVFQTVYYDEDGNLTEDLDQAEFYDMILASDIDTVTYQVDEDGTITLQLPGESGEYLLGYYYTDYEEEGYLTDYIFEYSQIYNPIKEEVVTMPEDAEVKTFSYITNETFGLIADVALYDYEELYIQGISEQYPEVTFKSFVEEEAPELAVVPNGQLVGMTYDRKFIYTAVGRVNPDYDENDETSLPVIPVTDGQYTLLLTYNEDNSISSISAYDESLVLVFNASENGFEPVDWFESLKLTSQSSFAGTPKDPTGLYYDTNLVSVLGFNNFSFTAPNISTDETVLETSNLTYSVYVDGEPIIFEENLGMDLTGSEEIQYRGVDTPTQWMPYTFQNDWDIYKRVGRPYEIGIYMEDVSTIGVQIRYEYEGETTYSGIITLDAETGEVTGVKDLESENIVISSGYFTVDGIKISNPQTGIFIKRSVLSNGKTVTTKVIKR